MEIDSLETAVRELASPSLSITLNHNTRFGYGLWFRGQSNCAWGLTPSVRRPNPQYHEYGLLNHFQMQNSNLFAGRVPVSDWLCAMQHYGVPTRLLDFTANMLVALYFSVREEDKHDVDGSIYVLNAEKLNEMYGIRPTTQIMRSHDLDVIARSALVLSTNTNDFVDTINYQVDISEVVHLKSVMDTFYSEISNENSPVWQRLRGPIAFWPKKDNGRIIAQDGAFVIFGGNHNVDYFGAGDASFNGFIKKYVVKNKGQILDGLKRIGFDDSRLFPELEHQARGLKALFAITP